MLWGKGHSELGRPVAFVGNAFGEPALFGCATPASRQPRCDLIPELKGDNLGDPVDFARLPATCAFFYPNLPVQGKTNPRNSFGFAYFRQLRHYKAVTPRTYFSFGFAFPGSTRSLDINQKFSVIRERTQSTLSNRIGPHYDRIHNVAGSLSRVHVGS